MEIFLIKALQFMLAISLLVLLHELGHFTFAKLFKVRVSRFYLFFNPKFHIVSTYDSWVRRLLRLKPEVVPTKEEEETDKDGKVTKKIKKEYVAGAGYPRRQYDGRCGSGAAYQYIAQQGRNDNNTGEKW
jgi:regulator of sigma E protease